MKNLALILILASVAFATPAQKPERAASPCAAALHDQMQLDNTNAQHLMDSFFASGLKQGILLGAGGAFLVVGLVAVTRKSNRPTTQKQPLTQAASA